MKEKKLRKSYKKILYLDDREPAELAEILAESCPIPIKIKRLKVGDYQIDDVVIERKEINDFAASITSKKKRLWKQFDKLLQCKYRYILISGKMENLKSDISPHSILGTMAWLAVHGVTVVKVDSDEDLAYLILRIFKHHGKLEAK